MKEQNIELKKITSTLTHSVGEGTVTVFIDFNISAFKEGANLYWRDAFIEILNKKKATKYNGVSLELYQRCVKIINIEPTLVQTYIDKFLKPIINETNKAIKAARKARNSFEKSSKSVIDKISI